MLIVSLDEKQEYCDEFCAIIRRFGHVALKTVNLQACGKFVAAAFRKEFKANPQKISKLVNGENRWVNAYPILHAKWLDLRVAEFLASL